MFILALGMVGVMSLFPVGLDATTRAINNQVVCLAAQTGFAQVNYMVNTSEVFDYRTRKPFYRASASQSSDTSVYYDLGDGRASWQSWMGDPYASPGTGRMNTKVGYYIFVNAGVGAGQVRRIVGFATNRIDINASFMDAEGNAIRLDGSSTFVVSKWALPRVPGSRRAALVDAAGGGSISAKSADSPLPGSGSPLYCNWMADEFAPTRNMQFFVVFLSGLARGKVLPVTGQSGTTGLSVMDGPFSPSDSTVSALSRVRPNDAFLILGTKDVSPVFPFNPDNAADISNFGQGNNLPDQTIPFGASRLRDITNTAAISASPYSYVVILSNAEGANLGQSAMVGNTIPVPMDAFSPLVLGREQSIAPGARADVLVFLNYDYNEPIQNQFPGALIGTSSATIPSLF
jgi:hypothetical protein